MNIAQSLQWVVVSAGHGLKTFFPNGLCLQCNRITGAPRRVAVMANVLQVALQFDTGVLFGTQGEPAYAMLVAKCGQVFATCLEFITITLSGRRV